MIEEIPADCLCEGTGEVVLSDGRTVGCPACIERDKISLEADVERLRKLLRKSGEDLEAMREVAQLTVGALRAIDAINLNAVAERAYRVLFPQTTGGGGG